MLIIFAFSKVISAFFFTGVGLGGFLFFVCFLFFSLPSPAISLGFTTLGEIFAYVTVF